MSPIVRAIAGLLQKFPFGSGQDVFQNTVDTLDASGTEFSSYLPDPLSELSDTDIAVLLSHRNNDGKASSPSSKIIQSGDSGYLDLLIIPGQRRLR